jgi:hypothetical protein
MNDQLDIRWEIENLGVYNDEKGNPTREYKRLLDKLKWGESDPIFIEDVSNAQPKYIATNDDDKIAWEVV